MANVWAGPVLLGVTPQVSGLSPEYRLFGGRSVQSRRPYTFYTPPYYQIWVAGGGLSHGGYHLTILEPVRVTPYGNQPALARVIDPSGNATYERFYPADGLFLSPFSFSVTASTSSSITLTETSLGAGTITFSAVGYIPSYKAEWDYDVTQRGLSLPIEPVVTPVLTSGAVTGFTISNRGEYRTNGFECTPAPLELALVGPCATTANLTLKWRPKSVSIRYAASLPVDDSRYASGVVLTGSVGNGTFELTYAASGGSVSVALLSVGAGTTVTPCTLSAMSTGAHQQTDLEYVWELDSIVINSGGTGYVDPVCVWLYGLAGPTFATSVELTSTADVRLLTTWAPETGTVHKRMVRLGYLTRSAVPAAVRIEEHAATATPTIRSRGGHGARNWEWRPTGYVIRNAAGSVVASSSSGLVVRIVGDEVSAVLPVAAMTGLAGALEVTAPAPRSGGVAATFSARHSVGAAVVLTAGSGFTSEPTVSVTGGGGSGATIRAVVSGAGTISQLVVTEPGTGYTSCPTVSITGGGGAGATARVTLQCIGIDVVTSGSGYSYRVTGSGWTADLTVDTTPGSATRGQVTGATMAGLVSLDQMLSGATVAPHPGWTVDAAAELVPVRTGAPVAWVDLEASSWQAASGSEVWLSGELDAGALGVSGRAVNWSGLEVVPESP